MIYVANFYQFRMKIILIFLLLNYFCYYLFHYFFFAKFHAFTIRYEFKVMHIKLSVDVVVVVVVVVVVAY